MKARSRTKPPAKRALRPGKPGHRRKNGSTATVARIAGGFKIGRTVSGADGEHVFQPSITSTLNDLFAVGMKLFVIEVTVRIDKLHEFPCAAWKGGDGPWGFGLAHTDELTARDIGPARWCLPASSASSMPEP